MTARVWVLSGQVHTWRRQLVTNISHVSEVELVMVKPWLVRAELACFRQILVHAAAELPFRA